MSKLIVYTILSNLLVGNAILLWAGLGANDSNVNYTLMLGMSIACTVVYLFAFNYLNFQGYTLLKMSLISILCCMTIILLGNSIALSIQDPGGFLPTIMMGIFGNVVLFPVSITLGLLNLFWFNKIKHLSKAN